VAEAETSWGWGFSGTLREGFGPASHAGRGTGRKAKGLDGIKNYKLCSKFICVTHKKKVGEGGLRLEEIPRKKYRMNGMLKEGGCGWFALEFKKENIWEKVKKQPRISEKGPLRKKGDAKRGKTTTIVNLEGKYRQGD